LAEAVGQIADEIVSSESDVLILVNEDDLEIGKISKGACHDGDGMLHRAFSLFVFNSAGELLLQQRSADKRLWPLFWSNSCCSHPRHGETMDDATHRRLYEELRMRGDLHFLYKFQYHAHYGDAGSENELCWVYVGTSDDPVQANGNEIADHRWVAPAELDDEMAATPEAFTPWFKMEWELVRERYRNMLGI
jgi:isopentenyl-diphosphate delta-isomerase